MLTSSSELISVAVIQTWEVDNKGEQHSISSVSSLLMFNRHTFFLPLKATTTLSTPKAPYQTAE